MLAIGYTYDISLDINDFQLTNFTVFHYFLFDLTDGKHVDSRENQGSKTWPFRQEGIRRDTASVRHYTR